MVIGMSKLKTKLDGSAVDQAIKEIADYFNRVSLEDAPSDVVQMFQALSLHLRNNIPIITKTRVAVGAGNFVTRFGVVREIEVLASAVRASEV